MASSKLLSARAIFEQNIQKNKEAGCDKTILGQKPKSTTKPCSNTVSRRLFASQQLSKRNLQDSSSNSNDTSPTTRTATRSFHGRRRLSNNSSGGISSSRNDSSKNGASSSSIGSQSSSSNNESAGSIQYNHNTGSSSSIAQPRGQSTIERRTSITTKNQEKEKPQLGSKSNHRANACKDPTCQDNSNKTYNTDSDRRRGSISSLAEHLGKLDIPSLRKSRTSVDGDNKSVDSYTSLTEHRNKIQLPDFRQSSVHRTKSYRQRKQQQDTAIPTADEMDESYDVHQLCRSGLDASSSSTVDDPASSSSLMDDSSRTTQRLLLKRSSSRRTSTCKAGQDSVSTAPMTDSSSGMSISGSDNTTSSIRRPSAHRAILSRHLSTDTAPKGGSRQSLPPRASSTSSSSSSNIAWIRPSAIVTADDPSCLSSPYQKPFKSVPFKTTIKRHTGKSTKQLLNDSNRSSHDGSNGSLDSSSESISCATRKSGHGTAPTRRRSSVHTTTTKRRSSISSAPAAYVKPPPPKPDPEEIAMREEMEALAKQIQELEIKVDQTQQGEDKDLERIEETKQRKLKKMAAQRDAAPTNVSSKTRKLLEFHQEEAFKEKFKQIRHTIKTLKQENARIDSQNRKLRLEILTTSSSNSLLEESNAEMATYMAELEAMKKKDLREHDQLVQIASIYQQGILDWADVIDKKDPMIERAKKMKLLYDDKIDVIVDMMQKKCNSFALIEELTIMAFGEEGTESGDEDGEDSDDSESHDRHQLNVCAGRKASTKSQTRLPYTKRSEQDDEEDEEDDSPRSVMDLIPTSSHSLHIFEASSHSSHHR